MEKNSIVGNTRVNFRFNEIYTLLKINIKTKWSNLTTLKTKTMICIQSAYIPKKRKTKYFYQWKGYLDSLIKESKGYDKHENYATTRH